MKTKTQTNTPTPMFTAALFIIDKRQKSTHKQMDEQNVVYGHTVEYDSPTKRIKY